jgi:hypothetical protein
LPKVLLSSTSVYARRLLTSTLPFRSVIMPREAVTTSLAVLLVMDLARFSLPCTTCALYSTAKNSSRNAPKKASSI